MKFSQPFAFVALAILGLASVQPALADDWVAEKLRGSVLVYQDGEWLALQRGDVVSDERYIKTLGNGRVQFVRGAETIALGGHTLIQIIDRDGQQFTNVHQHYGDVTVEAEKRDVQHFSVVTPYLAAVVKGTQFVVKSGSTGAKVSVDRGQVKVADPNSGTSVDIIPGQAVSVDPVGQFTVTAKGGAELPTVHAADGAAIEPKQTGKPNVSENANNSGNGNAGGNNGNGNGNAGGNNGNGNGNAGGNNGNGNGNAGGNNGNGNGNAGGNNGNGNGNAGGNNGHGNGNAGGNNGNGNGNAGGNNGNGKKD